VALALAAWWYLPLFLQFGLDPHRPEHEWFFRERTVVLGLKPWRDYAAWAGLTIPFLALIPFDLKRRRTAGTVFLALWLALGLALGLRSWRGFTATVPLLGCVAAAGSLERLLDRARPRLGRGALPLLLCLALGGGYAIQASVRRAYASPAALYRDPEALAFLERIARTCPDAVTADGDLWLTPDQTVGRCRSIVGLYLQYLPADAGERFRDLSRLYLLESEDEAVALCRRYGITLVIARKAFLGHVPFLFSPSSGHREADYFERRPAGPRFTDRGRRTLLFRLIASAPLRHFEKVCEQRRIGAKEPEAVAYRLVTSP
jgi:hypothetical protein